jgi:hypothetical protein
VTPLKIKLEAAQSETIPEEPRQQFQPIKPRGGSPTAASDEVIRGRGCDPYYYQDKPMPESDGVNPLQIQQCCAMLEQVEKTGKTPITLEWFRDYAMLHSFKFDWLESAEFRQRVIDKAIEAKGIKLVSIPGTKREDTPVTILERVRVELPKNGERYNPIVVRGEPVSTTLIRDRGGY